MICNLQNIFSLTGKTILITGGASGLGKHFAILLATHGAKVIVIDNDLKAIIKLENEIKKYDYNINIYEFDITDFEHAKDKINQIWSDTKKIDVLINNAGNAIFKPPFTFTMPEWDKLLDLHVKANWLFSVEIGQLMIKKKIRGSIINISSALTYRTKRSYQAYPAAKAALNQLTKSLALDFSEYNIRVNAIAPGWFVTRMTKDYLKTVDGGQHIKLIPFKRPGKFSELDGIILLLASDASTYITGALIPIDGGACISSITE